jgi:gamma-glutamyltranspeptidase/glutathione hydrolase
MAPTTARSAVGSALAVGSPGADRITTALMQVLGRSLLLGDDLQHAIDAPRLHVRFLDDGSPRVEHEPSDEITAAVRAEGLPAHRYPGPHMYFGGVGAALLGADGLVAAGDARREAAVGVSP